MTGEWRPTIGLEVHARLATRTKAFCRCELSFGAPPNSRTCPVCLGWPGSLPVLNVEAVRLAIRAAFAMRTTVALLSRFDRKNYFYPDLPKGYQITQAAFPLGREGRIAIHSKSRGEVWIRIERIHMEEDAGRTVHDRGSESRVDFNRAGAPLVEIVTAPDLESSDEAIACFSRIRQLLIWVAACDGNMEEGSIRCDANVSVSRTSEHGTRTETKNLNSFRFLGRAIDYEIERQIGVLECGDQVIQETRLFDVSAGATRPMRSKEEAHDYRFFPEPDLHPLVLDSDVLESERNSRDRLPDIRAAEYRAMFGMTPLESEAIASTSPVADLFEGLAARIGDHQIAKNWILNHVLRAMKENDTVLPAISIAQMDELIGLTRGSVISSTTARDVFDEIWNTSLSPRAIVEERGLAQSQNDAEIRELAARLIETYPEEAEGYRTGRQRLLGFFVGLIMKETKGKADPRLTSGIVKELLETK